MTKWTCRCGWQNYPNRTICRRCEEPKPSRAFPGNLERSGFERGMYVAYGLTGPWKVQRNLRNRKEGWQAHTFGCKMQFGRTLAEVAAKVGAYRPA